MRLRRPRHDAPAHILRQLKRRRWTRRGIFVSLVLLALSALLDRSGFFRYRGDDWANYDKQTVTVTRVVDGDTLRVRKSPASGEETVRMLGIDAPETTPPAAHWGSEATRELETRIEGKPVTLRLDATQTRDKYRRLLAYVHADSPSADNVNLALVRDGHAYAHRVFTHSLRRQFEQAEDEARGKGRGLWANVEESQMPAWRQRWLSDRRDRPR